MCETLYQIFAELTWTWCWCLHNLHGHDVDVWKTYWNFDKALSKTTKRFSNFLENIGSILTGLWLFFEVRAPFFKPGVILANFKQFGSFSLPIDPWK